VIIGTAGHIDHGKSALVEALTGRRMDPLAEEQRRGITIDLHFAPLGLPDGVVAGIIDVPGHEDLVRTMIAGAAGLDLILLVVAADEGIMPQTREHLAVAEQLRVPAGIPVLTKADRVGADRLHQVETELSRWLAASPVRFSDPIAVSTVSGGGLDLLRSRLEGEAAGIRARDAEDLARLPIDRAFTLSGAGTIVTGTAWSGVFEVGDAVRVLPAGRESRVRSLESHGQPLHRSTPGQRLAVGLAGVDRGELGRGQVLVHTDAPWRATRTVDAELELVPDGPGSVTHQARVRLHLGTLEVMARVHCPEPLRPGAHGVARLRLEQPAVARGGDRLVLRSYSPVQVIGGGRILDPLPPGGRAAWTVGLDSPAMAARLEALLARRPGGMAEVEVPVLLGISPAEATLVMDEAPVEHAGPLILSRSRVTEAAEAALAAVRSHHQLRPGEPGVPLETLRQSLKDHGAAADLGIRRLASAGAVVVEGGTVRDRAFEPVAAGGDALIERLVAMVDAAGLAPPSVSELEKSFQVPGVAEALRIAARRGQVVAVERERYFTPRALEQFTAGLLAVLAGGPITPARVRDQIGVSRKYLIPLLEWADQAGLTIRRGEGRVAGTQLRGPPGG